MAALDSDCTLTCDYLVVGAGATGLAFTDSLLKRTQASGKKIGQKLSIIIVDERDQPGGHWNDAYKFCRLHRPSQHYGVSSQELETTTQEGEGAHRATTNELLAYFGNVMDTWVNAGLVEYFPMHSFTGDNVLKSCLDPGRAFTVQVHRKIVDTTHLRVQGPSTRIPMPFHVERGAAVVQPGELTTLNSRPGYVIIGAGRTAIDVILWLLSRRADPTTMHWIMPRDPWMFRREAMDGDAWASTAENHSLAVLNSNSIDELVLALEKAQCICRVDPMHSASQFHGATVSRSELADLRRVRRIVRLGYVRSVHSDHIALEQGTYPMSPGMLVINCASQWLRSRPPVVPIWQPQRIVLQPVGEAMVGAGEFNITFSASLLGTVEALLADKPDSRKNEMCTPVHWPDTVHDWLRLHVIYWVSRKLWEDPRMRSLLCTDRLSNFSTMSMDGLRRLSDPSRETLGQRSRVKLEALLNGAERERKPSWSSTSTTASGVGEL